MPHGSVSAIFAVAPARYRLVAPASSLHPISACRVGDLERNTRLRLSALRGCVAPFPLTRSCSERWMPWRRSARGVERMREFESTRISAKAAGNRQLSSAERAALLRMREEIRLPHLTSPDVAPR